MICRKTYPRALGKGKSSSLREYNWLRNRAHSERMKGSIPMLAWNSNTRIDFTIDPEFRQEGHAFIS